LNKKKIIITGAGSGLGKMAAIELARRGHTVYATTKYYNQCDDLKNIAQKENLDLYSFKLDILLENDRNKLLDIDFDTLINNAAIGNSGSVSEIKVKCIRDVFETNVFSNIEITQIAIKKFIEKNQGRIIFISSLAGIIPFPFLSPYCASKSAIESFCTCLRKEIKKLDNAKIEICSILPGAYKTGFNKENIEKKYIWMEKNSYFKFKLNIIKNNEERLWNFIETQNFSSIINQYVKAVEDKKLKSKYTAPKIQAIFIQLCKIFGL
jgi:short-subunit dehydrogenase